ncbi:MAG: hypothetical protein M1839_008323 [Geoglossum umbratile]|nr:MAG: hypothetical protein M1839_008323 [Geoglossum umbratile]
METKRTARATSIYDDTHYRLFNMQTGLEDVKLDKWKTSEDAERRTVNITLRKIETMTRAYLESPGVREDIRTCAWRLVHLGDAAGQVS